MSVGSDNYPTALVSVTHEAEKWFASYFSAFPPIPGSYGPPGLLASGGRLQNTKWEITAAPHEGFVSAERFIGFRKSSHSLVKKEKFEKTYSKIQIVKSVHDTKGCFSV